MKGADEWGWGRFSHHYPLATECRLHRYGRQFPIRPVQRLHDQMELVVVEADCRGQRRLLGAVDASQLEPTTCVHDLAIRDFVGSFVRPG